MKPFVSGIMSNMGRIDRSARSAHSRLAERSQKLVAKRIDDVEGDDDPFLSRTGRSGTLLRSAPAAGGRRDCRASSEMILPTG
jgi:hypothetical protein